MEILRLVREQKIGVDEAERLLRALEDGERSRQTADDDDDDDNCDEDFDEDCDDEDEIPGARFEVHAGVGDRVWHRAFRSAHLGKNDLHRVVDGIRREIETAFASFDDAGPKLPAESQLTIVSAASELEIVASDDEHTQVENERGRVGRVRGSLYLDVGREGGIVRLGRAVTDLSIVSTAGEVYVRGLRCFTSIKTVGGNVALADQRGRFAVHCAGGEVFIEPAATLLGQSRVDCVGGECTIALLSNMSARVRATSFGGEVNVAPAYQKRRDGSATLVDIGARDDGPDIDVRVAGASVNVVQVGG